jgi:hypothetical protein
MKLPRLIAVLPLLAAPHGARACAVCMGANETVGEAMNAAIFVMLGCIFSMMALIASVAIYFARRKRTIALDPLEPSPLS